MKITALVFIHNPVQFRPLFASVFLWPLVRFFTGGHYNHCCLMCRYQNRTVFVEVTGQGVAMTEYEEWIKRAGRKTYTIACGKECDWLKETIGLRYSYGSLCFFKILKALTQRWYGHNWETTKKAILPSELAALAIGHPQPWGISIQELFDYQKQNAQKDAEPISRPASIHTEHANPRYA